MSIVDFVFLKLRWGLLLKRLNVPTSSSSKRSLVLLAEEGLAQYQGASLGIYDPINFR